MYQAEKAFQRLTRTQLRYRKSEKFSICSYVGNESADAEPSTLGPGGCGGGDGGVSSCPTSHAADRRRSPPAHCRPACPLGPASPCAAGVGGAGGRRPCCSLIGGGSPMPGDSSGSGHLATPSLTSQKKPRCYNPVKLDGDNVWHFDFSLLK